MRQMFRYIDYRQIHKRLDMKEVVPFDVGGYFARVGLVADRAAGKQDILYSLTLWDYSNKIPVIWPLSNIGSKGPYKMGARNWALKINQIVPHRIKHKISYRNGLIFVHIS